jgi:hypothetical protein
MWRGRSAMRAADWERAILQGWPSVTAPILTTGSDVAAGDGGLVAIEARRL